MTRDVFELIDTTIDDKYRVDEVVGEGGFGLVYRGFHLAFERPIAIKCLKVPGHFTSEARDLFHRKFREEGKHLAQLSEHPTITRVYDLGVTTGPTGTEIPYLVIEWLDGEDLAAMIRRRADEPMPEREALALLRPVIIDGQPRGTTPVIGVKVTPGVHTVIFKHTERGTKSMSVTVAPGQTRTVAVRF